MTLTQKGIKGGYHKSYPIFLVTLLSSPKKKASILISAELKKEADKKIVVVSVKDTGAGIDSEMLPRLFTKFASKSEMGGTGLGLYISKSIIDAHRGKIWSDNNSKGKGATFSFSLPLD